MGPPKGRVVKVLAVLVLFAWIARVEAAVQPLRPDEVPEALARVAHANRIYDRDMTVRQEYDVRALLMRWQFTGTVRKEGAEAHVELQGAPSFFPEDLSTTLFDVAQWLETFDVEYQGLEAVEGRTHHVFRGEPRRDDGSSTRWGTIWVDPETFLIDRILVQYWWGRVTIQQGFRTEGEYVLLDRQSARIDPLGIRAEVRWKDYRFVDRR
ncbi:LolA-like protein [Limnochorda pilosa]|uniref:Outer membrane lipoprotein-sorting protein n=1 Tax=Limnochorda pilosa TaxID=1555112 RepID=A0A0K2SJ17_LIMPI|nr:hypothetical protein [Limnochorda pilosa]BAS27022.1 hypothetical protein LIP_1165 [Limnochorda pilosa]